MQVVASFVLWVLFGFATSYFAQQRGRDPRIWFFIGMFLGLIGLLLLFLLPSYAEKEEIQDMQEIHVTPTSVTTAPEEAAFKNDSPQEWYYLDSQRTQMGPMALEVLKKKWEQGDITEKSLLWCEGMENWKAINELDLFSKE